MANTEEIARLCEKVDALAEQIDLKLALLKSGFEDRQAHLDSRLTRLDSAISDLSDHITGNGEPEKGVLIRLDRLEQTEGKKSYWAGNVALIFVSTTVGFLVEKIFGGK